jgi:hypothetical protein
MSDFWDVLGKILPDAIFKPSEETHRKNIAMANRAIAIFLATAADDGSTEESETSTETSSS